MNSPGNSLADTAAGYGRVANLLPGANGFTTIELKSNHLATALDGHVDCTARPPALFRCTQMVLHTEG